MFIMPTGRKTDINAHKTVKTNSDRHRHHISNVALGHNFIVSVKLLGKGQVKQRSFEPKF